MMTINAIPSQLNCSAMPMTDRGPAASVRALAIKGDVSAVAGSKSVFVDATPTMGYRPVTDVAVLKGAFPGTSVWRPPN
jgi:hypothetical protein